MLWRWCCPVELLSRCSGVRKCGWVLTPCVSLLSVAPMFHEEQCTGWAVAFLIAGIDNAVSPSQHWLSCYDTAPMKPMRTPYSQVAAYYCFQSPPQIAIKSTINELGFHQQDLTSVIVCRSPEVLNTTPWPLTMSWIQRPWLNHPSLVRDLFIIRDEFVFAITEFPMCMCLLFVSAIQNSLHFLLIYKKCNEIKLWKTPAGLSFYCKHGNAQWKHWGISASKLSRKNNSFGEVVASQIPHFFEVASKIHSYFLSIRHVRFPPRRIFQPYQEENLR